MKQINRSIRMQAATNNADRNRWRKMGGKHHNFAALIALIFICGIWTVAAHVVAKPFIFPYFEDVSQRSCLFFIRYVCTSQSWNYDAP